MRPPSIRSMRSVILPGMLLSLAALSSSSRAQDDGFPVPPRLISRSAFNRLLTAVKAEPFTDGKLQQVSAVAAGKRYVFTCGQVVTLLGAFDFWTDRLDALRLTPVVDHDNASVVLRYFDDAPATMRTEAQRILGAKSG